MTTDDIESNEQNAEGSASLSKRDVLSIAATVVLILLVLPFVVYAAPQAVGADHGYVVLSGSMEPTLSPGDVIIVEDVPTESISEGDVITFARGGEGQSTTHRVIEVVETEQGLEFRTAGDANEDPDPAPVPAEQVRGKIPSVNGHLFVFPYIGYVIQFAGTRLGTIALVITPLVLLVFSEAYELVRSTRRDDAPDDGPDDAPPKGADPTDGTVEETDAATRETAEDDPGVVLTPKDLRFSVALLTVFTGYAVWVAYTARETWSFTAASTAAAALVMIGGLFFFGGSEPDEEPTETVSGRSEPRAAGTVARAPDANGEPLGDGGIEAADGLGIPRTTAEPYEGIAVDRTDIERPEPDFEELEAAVVEVDSSAETDGEDPDETQPLLARSPLLYPLHLLFFYTGAVIAAPFEFVFWCLSLVGGGGGDE